MSLLEDKFCGNWRAEPRELSGRDAQTNETTPLQRTKKTHPVLTYSRGEPRARQASRFSDARTKRRGPAEAAGATTSRWMAPSVT